MISIGIYHGATGTMVKIAFVEGTESGKFKRLPTANEDGSLAKQAGNKRPLPAVVYVKMDNEKIDTDLIPERIVPFTIHEMHLTSSHSGKVVVTR